MAHIIDGKRIAKEMRAQIGEEVALLRRKGVTPGLAVIIVGEDLASKIYVRNKERACAEVGFYSEVIRLPETVSQEALLAEIDRLKNDGRIHGILVQVPLPEHIDERTVLAAIPAEKDVDGFHVQNIGALMCGRDTIAPCTPAGCMELIHRSGVALDGAHAVVLGRSNTVGKPVAMLLLQQNCTVTICHSRTKDLAGITRQADILVSAVGKMGFVTADMVKPGAVVIDVGINRKADGHVVGDVDYVNVEPVAGAITPVPGGVGPMTITMLLKNTLEQAKKHG